MVVGKQDSDMQENQTELVSHKMYKKKFKMIKDLNAGHETINLLRENISNMIFDISLGNIFLICLLRQRKQQKIIKPHYIKLFHCEENYQQNENTAGEDIAYYISNKGLLSKIYNELIQLNIKKTNNLI